MGTIKLSKWSIASARVKGILHKRKDASCQDWIEIIRNEKVVAIVLSDGAGSKTLSDIGSRYAAQGVGKLLVDCFDELFSVDEQSLRETLIDKSLEKIRCEADEKQNDIGEYSATLLFVAISKDRFIAGNLGDGVIGFEKGGANGVMFHPIRGEFANQTFFITHKDATRILEIRRGELDRITGFVLMTDGVSDLLYSRTKKELSAACNSLVSWLRQYSQKKVSKALENNIKKIFQEKTCDDCSLAILGRISLSKESLWQMPEDFISEFLECSTRPSLQNRMAIIDSMAKLENTELPIQDINHTTKLSLSIIKQHQTKIRRSIDLEIYHAKEGNRS